MASRGGLNGAALALALTLAGALASESALADRGHRHRGQVQFGISIGAPVYWGGGYWGGYWGPPHHFYYPGPLYYPAPLVVTPPVPHTYIEQPALAPAPALTQTYWYYCAESQTYYPYVKQCAGAWQRVIPHAPPG